MAVPVDLPRMLREYARLDRARTATGLSDRQLERWRQLKDTLDGQLSRGSKGRPPPVRRASLRVPSRLKVSFESVGTFHSSMLTNVSKGGVFVHTDTPLEVGDPVTLRISIEEDATTLEIPGRVVSQNVGPTLGTWEKGMGVVFGEMAPKLREQVDALYERAVEAHARELAEQEQQAEQEVKLGKT